MIKLTENQIDLFEKYGWYINESEDCLEFADGFQIPVQLISDKDILNKYTELKKLENKKTITDPKKLKVKDTSMWCFVLDNDGHWYKIPLKLKSMFEDWVESSSMYEETLNRDDLEDVPDFNDYRCMHPVNYMFEKILVLKENT